MSTTRTGREPVIIVSNRGPVEHRRVDGERQAERGAGGLVTALSHLSAHLEDATWICAALSDEDVEVAREHPDGFPIETAGGAPLTIRMVELDREAQRKHYTVVSNPLLWFIQHYLWDLADEPNIGPSEVDAYERGYVPVNAAMADAVSAEFDRRAAASGGRETPPAVMVHDYHFYLLPAMVRARRPEVFLHHFVHIPWPQPDAWRVLPPRMREELFFGLLGNDVVGFHTERYARNFLLGCQELLGLTVDLADLSVEVDGRTVATRWYPISVDAAAFEALAASRPVLAEQERLAQTRREHLILRVDRTDPSKNILRGFRAFDLLLDNHPELRERLTFLALLQPSRQDVPQYVEYVERIQRLVADVNLKHGTPDWQPIDFRLEDNFELAVAAYKMFDVLLVNGIFDGMNLVAKEAVVVNERDGVLALSENTGAHEELGNFAVTLHPFDVGQQAEALYEALMMPPAERKSRREVCAAIVRENDVAKWLAQQLADVHRLRREGQSAR